MKKQSRDSTLYHVLASAQQASAWLTPDYSSHGLDPSSSALTLGCSTHPWGKAPTRWTYGARVLFILNRSLCVDHTLKPWTRLCVWNNFSQSLSKIFANLLGKTACMEWEPPPTWRYSNIHMACMRKIPMQTKGKSVWPALAFRFPQVALEHQKLRFRFHFFEQLQKKVILLLCLV